MLKKNLSHVLKIAYSSVECKTSGLSNISAPLLPLCVVCERWLLDIQMMI
jgi:hypothetical protein